MTRAMQEAIRQYHSSAISPGQCGSMHVQHIAGPLPIVWSLVRQFDRPQSYKRFVKSCYLRVGEGGVGSVREVWVASGLPAATSTERLEALDDNQHVMIVSIVGGDHRLANYRSTTTLHDSGDGGTVVMESYIVDVPPGSTEEETCIFVDTIVKCNLRSLANVVEKMARSSSNG